MKHIRHLSKDMILKKAIQKAGTIELSRRENIFFHLLSSIMSQQLSTKVAAVIKKRFVDMFGGIPDPEQVLKMDPLKLRSIGLSNAKVRYVQNVARFALEKGMQDDRLSEMDNETLINYLTEIKGVGQWTVEMLLMFTLGREDVFAADDLGIQNAMINLYGIRVRDKKKLRNKMIKISESWSPYRTYACLYLWRWKDDGNIVSKKKKIIKKSSKPLKRKKIGNR
jgi:DNA-3-methyladenine glycosylase II